MEERLFDRPGFKPYALRYGLCIVPALLTIFGADLKQMLLILGIGIILSGVIQWLLSHKGNELYLSTTWTANRVKLQTNSKVKTEREREKQLAQRRAEAMERAKREGKLTGWAFGFAGAGLIIASLLMKNG